MESKYNDFCKAIALGKQKKSSDVTTANHCHYAKLHDTFFLNSFARKLEKKQFKEHVKFIWAIIFYSKYSCKMLNTDILYSVAYFF